MFQEEIQTTRNGNRGVGAEGQMVRYHRETGQQCKPSMSLRIALGRRLITKGRRYNRLKAVRKKRKGMSSSGVRSG